MYMVGFGHMSRRSDFSFAQNCYCRMIESLYSETSAVMEIISQSFFVLIPVNTKQIHGKSLRTVAPFN